MRHVLLLAVFAMLAAGSAAAKPVTLEYFDLPPYSYDQDGLPAGSALTLAYSLTAGLDIALRPELVPLRRLALEAGNKPVIIAAITRTPQREALYQWIGRLCSDAFVMGTRARNPVINTLDEARRLKQIAVVAGASNETFLRDQGFTNLDVAASIELEVRRLAEGYDDAWFAPRSGALHAWKKAGYDPSTIQFGAPLWPMEFWMAGSPTVPAPLIATLRARFAEAVKSGAVAAATGCAQ